MSTKQLICVLFTVLHLWPGLLSIASAHTVLSWIPNGNFENLENWSPPVSPCKNDRMIFNSSDVAHLSIIIQKNHTIRELVLPMTGSFLFGENAGLEFSSKVDRRKRCSRLGRDIRFVGGQSHDWFNPGNWCTGRDCTDPSAAAPTTAPATPATTTTAPATTMALENATNSNNSTQQNNSTSQSNSTSPSNSTPRDISTPPPVVVVRPAVRAYVDLERVPCQYDQAYFPEPNFIADVRSQFEISLDNIEVKLHVYRDSASFQSYIDGEGQYSFVTTERGPQSKFILRNQSCPDELGCICDNFHHQTEKEICGQVGICPTKFLCSSPINITGDCCGSCGSRLLLRAITNSNMTNATFNFNDFVENVTRHEVFDLAQYENVTVSITRVKPADILNQSWPLYEVVTKDNKKGESAAEVLCHIREFLMEESVQLELAVFHVAIETSDGKNCYVPPLIPTHSPSLLNPDNPHFKWIIVGIVLIFLVLLAVLSLITFFLYRRRRNRKSPGMEMDTVLYDGNGAAVQGFDNPVFDVPIPLDDDYAVTYNVGDDKISGIDDPSEIGVDPGLPSASRMPTHGRLEITGDPLADEDDVFAYATPGKPSKKKKSKKEKRSGKKGAEGFANPVYESHTPPVKEKMEYHSGTSDHESLDHDSPVEEEIDQSPDADPRIDIPDNTKIVGNSNK